MKNTFCLGNGESRIGFDLNQLRLKGNIYGCNALYRDFKPNLLVSVNQKMTKEIQNSGYTGKLAHMENFVDINHKLIKVIIIDGIQTKSDNTIQQYYGKVPGWSSGNVALLLSCEIEKPENVFLIGFDFFADSDNVNNIYKDTQNYAKSDSLSCPCNGWISDMGTTFNMFPNVKFYRVGREEDIIDKWKDINNVQLISFDKMKEMIK